MRFQDFYKFIANSLQKVSRNETIEAIFENLLIQTKEVSLNNSQRFARFRTQPNGETIKSELKSILVSYKLTKHSN